MVSGHKPLLTLNTEEGNPAWWLLRAHSHSWGPQHSPQPAAFAPDLTRPTLRVTGLSITTPKPPSHAVDKVVPVRDPAQTDFRKNRDTSFRSDWIQELRKLSFKPQVECMI